MIVSDDEQDNTPSLPFVTNLTVDREGNIYVYAGSDGVNLIHKYGASGNYLQTFGREGRGPGEHLYISDLYVDKNNRLITADRENARISVFDEGYEVINIKPLTGISNVHQIGETPGGHFVLGGWNAERESMLHLMESEFEGYKKSWVSPDSLAVYYENATAKQWVSRSAGYFYFPDGGRLFFVPNHYDGTIYEYRKNQQGSWNLHEGHRGYARIESPLAFTQMSADLPANRINGLIRTQEGAAMISVNSESHGIYPLKNGTFLHLSHRWNTESEEYELVMEHFSKELVLLKHSRTDTLGLGTTSRKLPYWVDRSGQMYLADNSGESTGAVRRYQINGLGLER